MNDAQAHPGISVDRATFTMSSPIRGAGCIQPLKLLSENAESL